MRPLEYFLAMGMQDASELRSEFDRLSTELRLSLLYWVSRSIGSNPGPGMMAEFESLLGKQLREPLSKKAPTFWKAISITTAGIHKPQTDEEWQQFVEDLQRYYVSIGKPVPKDALIRSATIATEVEIEDDQVASLPDGAEITPTRKVRDGPFHHELERWEEIYIAEVCTVVERFRKHSDLGRRVEALITMLEGYTPGEFEGRAEVNRAMATARGAERLLQVAKAKALLLRKLKELVAEVVGTSRPLPNGGTALAVLTVPIVARICWCMMQAGNDDHRILQRTTANRIARRYGLTSLSSGQKLKEEWNRLCASDGHAHLIRAGWKAAHAMGVWAKVKEELAKRGEHAAASKAQVILDEL